MLAVSLCILAVSRALTFCLFAVAKVRLFSSRSPLFHPSGINLKSQAADLQSLAMPVCRCLKMADRWTPPPNIYIFMPPAL